MNKLVLLCGTALLMSLTAAAEYPSMEFSTVNGDSKIVKADGLVITVQNSKLIITNSANESLELNAADLQSMKFSDVEAAVADVAVAIGGSVVAYTVDGVEAGEFVSVADAVNTLAPGLYLLKNSEGQTVKVVVGK